jgi:hypothetical protein
MGAAIIIYGKHYMNIKSAILAATLGALAMIPATANATSSLTVGDSLTLEYMFPFYGNNIQSTTFTYSGAGQTVTTQFGITTLDIVGNGTIAFQESPGCGNGCYQTPASFNGPTLIDNSNGSAFTGWNVVSDTVGISSSTIGGGVAAVNWQGQPVQGEVVLSGVSGVPEASTWVMMLAGFAGLGFVGYRRNKMASVAA